LTFADVTILHDIVLHAQELLPSLPERERVPTNALFNAYYAILPRIGIDIDHDSRYARVLFKIGGMRGDGSLYEKFETVLFRMGIELQFEEEDNHTQQEDNTERHSGQDSDPPPYLHSTSEVVGQERGRPRRNSDGSQWDATLRHQIKQRSNSFVATPHTADPASSLDSRPHLPKPIVQPVSQTYSNIQHYQGVLDQNRGYDLGAWLNSNVEHQPQNVRTRSVSSYGSIRLRRRSPPTSDQIPSISSLLPLSEGLALAPRAESHLFDQGQGSRAVSGSLRDERDIRLAAEPPMDINVSFHHSRAKNVLSNIWNKWHQRTLQLREDNRNLSLLAKHRDKQVLLRQAFDSWHTSTTERRQSAETERFFAHLERRAGRARDLFLLTKALTHWAYSASDEVQRTSVARRHMLRTRYFRAWREITAVNELKIRRYILRTFFSVWQRKHLKAVAATENAVTTCSRNLVQQIFWTWFWTFCERRAPVWSADRLQRKVLLLWNQATKKNKDGENIAMEIYRRNTSLKIYITWKRRTEKHVAHLIQANQHRTELMSLKSLAGWRRASRVLHPLNISRDKVDLRLKRQFFGLWALRAGQESRAAAIDRLKIMREAWITWNDKLRCQAVQMRMSDRLVLQGLYKWVLAERFVLARRLLEQRLMKALLQKITTTSKISNITNLQNIHLAQELRDRNLIWNGIRSWQQQSHVQFQHEHLAAGFSSPLALRDTLTKWLDHSQRMQQLQMWARDGAFYFLASKTMRIWKDATEQVKREKRRDAYARFRRRSKVNLASNILSIWQEQAKSYLNLDQGAVELYYNRKVILCVEMFDRWRGRVEEVKELQLMEEQSLLRKHFAEMRLSLVNHQQLAVEAINLSEERTTASSIKKWSRMALQLRASQHLVLELREKYLKKTMRKIMTHWRQGTSVKQRLGASGFEEPPNDRMGLWKSKVGFRERAESWSEFDGNHHVMGWDDELDENPTSTRAPAYLTTPSKKVSRARAIARLPSTTPIVPLSTPAERHLRAQYSGGALPSFRKTLGRSLLSGKGTSANMEEGMP
jgi:protein SFI1